MTVKARAVASFCLLLWLLPGVAMAVRRGKLVGKVHDPDGKGLAGVVVTITSPQIPDFREVLTTDKKGVFSVSFRQIDVTYHYRFDKPGYQTLESDQDWHLEGTGVYDWTMQPGSVAPVGGPPPASASQEAIDAYNAGVVASRSKDFATAEAKFREAATRDPKLRQAWEALASASLELGHDREAAEAAEKAIALGSRAEPVLLVRWQAYKRLNDEAKAAEALAELESTGRRAEEAKKIHNEAVALMKAKDYQGAFAKFQEAVAVDPNLEVSLIGLAEAGLKTGHNAEAAAAVETVLKTDPHNEQAIRLRYNACLALQDKERLVEALVGIAPFEPTVARNGLMQLALEAYDANESSKAKERFEKVIAVDPSYPQAYYYMGVIEINQGATAEAKRHLERFLQLAPNTPEAADARAMLEYMPKK